MKVKDLIEKLKEFDGDLEVEYPHPDIFEFFTIEKVYVEETKDSKQAVVVI